MEQDKLQFARNYKNIRTKLVNRKKTIKAYSMFIGIVSLFMSLLFFINPIAASVYLVFSIAIIGSIFGFGEYKNRKEIKNCNKGCEKQFTYKEFKQMKKSGELDKLIEDFDKKEAEEMYPQYLEFVKGKTYSTVKTSSIESNEEIKTDNDIEINNNL